MNSRYIFFLGLAAGLIGVLVIASFALSRPYQFYGSLYETPVPVTDFSLRAQENEIFTLSDNHGKVILLFFGYTQCPDVCPATLAIYKELLTRLGDQAGRAKFVFITVDPARDTPEILAAHTAKFDPAIIPLTGDESTLETVYQQFGVYREKRTVSSEIGYLMDHTARIYVLDKTGQLRLTYPFGFEVDYIFKDLQHLISEK